MTLILPRLVNKGFLVAAGEGKNKYYTLPGVDIPTPDKVFVASELPKRIASDDDNITHSEDNITHNENNITHKSKNITLTGTSKTVARDQYGRLLSAHLPKPIIDDLETLSIDFYKLL